MSWDKGLCYWEMKSDNGGTKVLGTLKTLVTRALESKKEKKQCLYYTGPTF